MWKYGAEWAGILETVSH